MQNITVLEIWAKKNIFTFNNIKWDIRYVILDLFDVKIQIKICIQENT